MEAPQYLDNSYWKILQTCADLEASPFQETTKWEDHPIKLTGGDSIAMCGDHKVKLK